jgi:hypothetical protein
MCPFRGVRAFAVRMAYRRTRGVRLRFELRREPLQLAPAELAEERHLLENVGGRRRRANRGDTASSEALGGIAPNVSSCSRSLTGSSQKRP